MRKLIALLTACMLLTAVLPALAEEPVLHTFAGIPWETPKLEFIAVASEKLGIPFEDYPAEVFRETDPSFVIQNGYYSVLGLPLSGFQGISVRYARTEALKNGEVEWTDPAAWTFESITCVSDELPMAADAAGKPLPGALQLAQDVADNVIARYGTPSGVYVALGGWGYSYYLAPAEEAPYIVADAAAFAAMNDVSNFLVILVIDNVLYKLDATLPEYNSGRYQDGSYAISIEYLSHPVGTADFSAVSYRDHYEADSTEPFPFFNGAIQYTVIEP